MAVQMTMCTHKLAVPWRIVVVWKRRIAFSGIRCLGHGTHVYWKTQLRPVCERTKPAG